ncbi:hypothetical protein N566_18690 [Streptomycetaceae bacterium MP113-05]|nr:hypothetical protein N566_18690 [Streptomycetaceae bacterium MP113-05]
MEALLRPLIVLGCTVALTLLLGWVVDRLLHAADRRHPETPLWGLLRGCRIPLQIVLVTSVFHAAYDWSGIDTGREKVILKCLALVTVAGTVWLTVRITSAVADTSLTRFATNTSDPRRVRRFRTQLSMIQRVATFLVAVVAGSVAILVLFPGMRTLGASLLASAGVIGIVAGVAAQAMLGNLFAGLQVAFGSSVKIGDTVVVEGEWGVVEEITLAFLTVRIWDDRRLTMPVSYFNSKPYENWSRGGTELTCTVYLHLDHCTPIGELREYLRELLETRDDWDRRTWSLVVTDTTPTTIQVRAAMSAKDTDDWWTLQCGVREELLTWVRRAHPYALPRVATAPAAEAPGALTHQPVPSQGGARDGAGPGGKRI